MTDIQSLAAPLPTPSAADWRRLVEKALGGASFDSLRTTTREGIAIELIHRQARDARPLFARPGEGAWQVIQRLDHPDAGEGNAQARRELERGVTGLALVPEGAPAAEGFGIASTTHALDRTLDGIDLGQIHLRVEPHPGGPATALRVADLLDARGVDPAKADVAFGLDPIGVSARRGGFGNSSAEDKAGDADIHLVERGFIKGIYEADGRIYAAAGADAVQELAAVLATAAAYLSQLDELGTPPQHAFPLIGVTLTVDADLLASIAKLRAARLLWARMQEVCGAPRSRLRLHGETARLMMMRADPHTNLLRTTIAAFAGGVGGADSVTVLPFTIALGLPDAFARRLARNTQLLLIEESHLHRVADPAAGSGAVETLTQELSRRAWEAFRAIEREGGIVESLAAGRIQARIAEQRTALVEVYRKREAGLVGVTHYVEGEAAPVKLAELPPRREQRGGHPVQFAPVEPFDLEAEVSRVPESAP